MHSSATTWLLRNGAETWHTAVSAVTKGEWHLLDHAYNPPINKKNADLKASAHSFKRFILRQFLKISFSLYASITSDECHARFHLNASSPAARNTEQVNITKHSNLQHLTASRLQVHRHNYSDTTRLMWEGIKCPWNLYLYAGLKINLKCVCIYGINNMSVVFHYSLITYQYCKKKTVIKYLHWSICKTIQMSYHDKAATCRCMYITSTMCRLSGISLIIYKYC